MLPIFVETNSSSCLSPLVKDENNTCRIPCDWSLMSPKLRDIYYGVMVMNFWAALITTIITLATLASFSKMYVCIVPSEFSKTNESK